MAHVLSGLRQVDQPAAGKLDGLEREPLSTSASEAQSSADGLPVQLALDEALHLKVRAGIGQSQDGTCSTQDQLHDAATQHQGIEVPKEHLQAEIQAMSVVQASPP